MTEHRTSERRADRLRIGVGAALLCLVILAPIIFTTDDFCGAAQDLPNAHLPIRDISYQALRRGEWPLWNPHVANGLPNQTGCRTMAYPLHLLGWVMEAAPLIRLSIVLHVFLGIASMAWMLGVMGLSLPARLLGGLTFGAGGFVLGRAFAGHIDWVEPVAWLPLYYGLLLRAMRRPGSGWTLAAGTALGIIALAGNYQATYIAAVGGVLLALVLVLSGARHVCLPLDWRQPWRSEASDRCPEAPPWEISGFPVAVSARLADMAWAAARVLVVSGVSVGLAAFRLFPGAESLLASNRLQGTGHFDASTMRMPWSLLSYLVPHFFELPGLMWSAWPPWETQGYLGVAALCLAGIGLTGSRRAWLVPAVLLALSLGLSLGPGTPLHTVWKALDPLSGYFREPGRFALLVAVFGAWLASLGCDALHRGALHRLTSGAACLAVAAPVLCLWLWLQLQQGTGEGWAALVRALAAPPAWSWLSSSDGLAVLLRQQVRDATIALLLCAAVLATVWVGRRSGAWGGLALALVDLALFARPYLVTAPHARLDVPQVAVRIVTEHDPHGRILCDPSLGWLNRFVAHGLYDAGGYEYFLAPAYVRTYRLMRGARADIPQTVVGDAEPGPLWDLLSARWAFRTRPLEHPSWRRFAQAGPLLVYENVGAFPRAYIVHAAASAPVLETQQRAATDAQAFRTTAWMAPDQPIPEGLGTVSGGSDAVEHLVFSENTVSLDARLDSTGILVLTDAAWPGWHVSVDGRETEVLALDGNLHRGVALGPGAHRVVFWYWPRTLTVGLTVSVVMGLCLAMLALPRRQPV